MTSRFLTASFAAIMIIGLASHAEAQKKTDAGRSSSQGTDDRATPQSVAPADGPTTPVGQDTTTSRDPFEAAAKASTTAEGTSGESSNKTEKATFGAGCFWHVEAAFEWLPGVKSAVSGYAGGSVPNPDYELVHTGMSGHAEVVQVEYDPAVISYQQLLKVFWSSHDPTQLNRQGPDIGTQYRSVIFYHNEAQRPATYFRARLPRSDRHPTLANAKVLPRGGLPPELLWR
jgi:peptide-methionine (S)-S-oxide reductase